MATRTVRARYTAGRVDGVDVPAYTEEPGVNPTRGTETFAQVLKSTEVAGYSNGA
jgi:glucose-6-phosphate 1-dehydrogenase